MRIQALQIASHLTDPICKVRESFYSFYTIKETCKTNVEKIVRAATLALTLFVCTLLAPFTAPLGAMIRGVVATPYIYQEKGGDGKTLPAERKITLFAHNECYMPGGYSITDGQVTPPSNVSRMEANVRKIKELDPDVVCLYEVPDICDANRLSTLLENYPYLIPVAGIRAIGPSSMMYVASKYEIAKESIQFIPFIKGVELTGRAQNSEKGFLLFDLKSKGENAPFVTIVSTHLQHSEVPASPTEEEKRSRLAQMTKIAEHIGKKIEGSVVFVGDLNQDEEEIKKFVDANPWLRRDVTVLGKPTWGGDTWCSKLMNKPASKECVLDYAFIAGKTKAIATKIIDTGYSGSKFGGTSDHQGLMNTISL